MTKCMALQIAGHRLLTPLDQIILSKVSERITMLDNVIKRFENPVGNGHDRFRGTQPRSQTEILAAQVGPLCPDSGPGCLHQMTSHTISQFNK
jgi:hypothetical protein